MGYQVGFQCFETLKEAQNYKYSSVAPVINQNGQLVQPEQVGQQWQLNGIQIVDSFPQCSPLQQVLDGIEMGWALIVVAVSMVGVAILRRGL